MRSLSLLLLATPLLTLPQENPTQRPRPGAQPESTERGTANRSDGLLAGWVLIDSNNEIALAQIAEQRSRNQEVKQFAQQMIADHRELAQKLQRYASSAGFSTTMPGITGGVPRRDGDDDGRNGDDDRNDGERERGTGTTQGQQPRPGETRPGETPGATGFGASTGEVNHVQLIQELGKQCLESTRKELEQRSGADFDRFYMNLAVAAHMRTNDTLTVFERHASGEVRNVLSEGKRKVESHLERAKDLCKRFEDESYGSKNGDGRMDGDRDDDRKDKKDDDDKDD